MKASMVRINAQQQSRLLAQLRKMGAPIPPKAPWDDEVTYNNTLLEMVELAQEVKS